MNTSDSTCTDWKFLLPLVRYLIECATGIYTGSMYHDSSLKRKGMYGEGVAFDSGLTLLQKTHGYTIRKKIVSILGSKVCHLNPYLFTMYLQWNCGSKVPDLPVRHAWVSQRVLFDMPRHVRLRQCL